MIKILNFDTILYNRTMGKIHLIRDFEKIAAGEVIQRPVSVVKELIENSLDAQSTQVFIDLKNAGKDLIKIEDNGIGIEEEDLGFAFQRHTSSKVDSVEDLDDLHTLGFRGEALASVGVVAQVEIISRPANQSYGVRLIVENGHEQQKEQCGAPLGTSLAVKNLFYNLPVRRKYMKSKQVELGHISDLVTRYALAYPMVHFRLVHNNLTLLNSPAFIPNESKTAQVNSKSKLKTLVSLSAYGHAIQSIFGKKIYDQMVPIDFEDESLHFYGYFGNPEINRSDRYAASIFINHRLVRNKQILQIINDAYQGYLMRHRFPFFVVFLDLPPDRVDFNIHPSKQTVKFVNEEDVMNRISYVCRQNVKKLFQSQIETTPTSTTKPTQLISEEKSPFSSIERELNDPRGHSDEFQSPSPINSTNLRTQSTSHEKSKTLSPYRTAGNSHQNYSKSSPKMSPVLKYKTKTQKELIPKPASGNHTQTRFNLGKNAKLASPIHSQPLSDEHSHSAIQSDSSSKTPPLLTKSHLTVSNLPSLNYLNNGVQAGNTYLIFQNSEGLILIDQHAAHERINLEKVTRIFSQDKIPIQNLLSPMKIEVSPAEVAYVQGNLGELSKIGFQLDYFGGNLFLIRTVPAFFSQYHLSNSVIISICLDLIHIGKDKTFSTIKTEILQYLACHQSLRGGDEIWDLRIIERLIKELDQCDNPGHCAHGRPTLIKISFKELEKRFHRIV